MSWRAELRRPARLHDAVFSRPLMTSPHEIRRERFCSTCGGAASTEGTFVHPCCARPGRVPGSLFLFWEDFLAEGAYREAADIAQRARAAGLHREQDVIVYCHRGARAATALYGLRRAGFPHVRVFVGSWHEWAERRDLPALSGSDVPG